MKALESYHWPGNVRELRNVLERALVLAGGGIVELEHLPWEMQEQNVDVESNDGRFNSRVEAYKKRLLLEALRKHGWVKKEAAKELGLSQRAFSHYVARFGLDSHRLDLKTDGIGQR
jgi:transcriptional regulator with PAS, ATPase and Fis domain